MRTHERPKTREIRTPEGHIIDEALREYAIDKLHMKKGEIKTIDAHLLENGKVCPICQAKVTNSAYSDRKQASAGDRD